MIAVLDYGIGNLRSAEKAMALVGGDARLVTDPDEALGAAGVVLPGVGAFGACAQALRNSGLDEAVLDALSTKRPFLGICVGFQLLFEGSEESPHDAGLGIVPGVVRRLGPGVKLPQMQWNTVQAPLSTPSKMLAEDAADAWFYFVHSFAPRPDDLPDDALCMTADYGRSFVASIERDALWGTQFHPEKSAHAGLRLLSRFVARCEDHADLASV